MMKSNLRLAREGPQGDNTHVKTAVSIYFFFSFLVNCASSFSGVYSVRVTPEPMRETNRTLNLTIDGSTRTTQLQEQGFG
ncbi:hypothetical protein Bca4012_057848 [Brassica carinata]